MISIKLLKKVIPKPGRHLMKNNLLTHRVDLGTLDDYEDITMVVGCPVYIKEGAFSDFPQKRYNPEWNTAGKL